ncbi:MAG: hypothetical protein ACK52I_32700 [Pseudomonadota bacterium]
MRLIPYCSANSYSLAEDCWICARTAGVVVAFLCSAIIMRPGSRE